MGTLLECWRRLRERERGQSAVESALLLALVTVVVLAVLAVVAVEAHRLFTIIGSGYEE